jgi:hypothetical protein
MPERMHNSVLLNCRRGNFAARKSDAAMVVVENESFSVVALFVVAIWASMLPYFWCGPFRRIAARSKSTTKMCD